MKTEISNETKDTSTNATIKSRFLTSKNSLSQLKMLKSERKMPFQRIALNFKPSKLMNNISSSSAYQNGDNCDIKFFDGNVQREAPQCSDVRSYLRNSHHPSQMKIRKINLVGEKTHDFSSSGHSPISNLKDALLPYNDFRGLSDRKKSKYHERNSSNLSLPKLEDVDDFQNYKEAKTRLLQSEQKRSRRGNFYIKFKSYKPSEVASPENLYKRHKLKSVINSGSRNLRRSDIMITNTNKTTLSIEKFKLNVKDGDLTKADRQQKSQKSERKAKSKNHSIKFNHKKVSPYVPSTLKKSQEYPVNPTIEITLLDSQKEKSRNNKEDENSGTLTESLPSINDPKGALLQPYSLKSGKKRYPQ